MSERIVVPVAVADADADAVAVVAVCWAVAPFVSQALGIPAIAAVAVVRWAGVGRPGPPRPWALPELLE